MQNIMISILHTHASCRFDIVHYNINHHTPCVMQSHSQDTKPWVVVKEDPEHCGSIVTAGEVAHLAFCCCCCSSIYKLISHVSVVHIQPLVCVYGRDGQFQHQRAVQRARNRILGASNRPSRYCATHTAWHIVRPMALVDWRCAVGSDEQL